MKQTFITSMPDESGAFLKASYVIADAGANITRVSYNKAVDAHMLFLDVDGTETQLKQVAEGLENIGYIQSPHAGASVMLLEFLLRDVPGAVSPVLELIQEFDFNITYISSQENETEYQFFKMALLVESPQDIKEFLDRVTKLCEVRIIEYEYSEKNLDNTVFYMGFVNQMSEKLSLSYEQSQELMKQSNLVMQLLDTQDEPPHKTFEYIGKFADALHSFKKEKFNPRVTRYELEKQTTLYVIEPPCGSNMYVYEQEEGLVFVDSGFACYEEEMRHLLSLLISNFENKKKEVLVTHPDIDHCGLLTWFECVHVLENTQQHFLLEQAGEPNYREMNPAHAPYCKISRILTGYEPPRSETLCLLAEESLIEQDRPLVKVRSVLMGTLVFDIYRGNGGHAIGDTVFVDTENHLVFCGDILVNVEGFSPEQKAFNRLAPYLMTSVNMDSKKAQLEREHLLGLFDAKDYTFCCGHGAPTGRALNPKQAAKK